MVSLYSTDFVVGTIIYQSALFFTETQNANIVFEQTAAEKHVWLHFWLNWPFKLTSQSKIPKYLMHNYAVLLSLPLYALLAIAYDLLYWTDTHVHTFSLKEVSWITTAPLSSEETAQSSAFSGIWSYSHKASVWGDSVLPATFYYITISTSVYVCVSV